MYMSLPSAKKSGKAVVELVEGEQDVINLKKVEGAMQGAVSSLKHEYTTAITGRITPGMCWLVLVHVGGETLQVYHASMSAQVMGLIIHCC